MDNQDKNFRAKQKRQERNKKLFLISYLSLCKKYNCYVSELKENYGPIVSHKNEVCDESFQNHVEALKIFI